MTPLAVRPTPNVLLCAHQWTFHTTSLTTPHPLTQFNWLLFFGSCIPGSNYKTSRNRLYHGKEDWLLFSSQIKMSYSLTYTELCVSAPRPLMLVMYVNRKILSHFYKPGNFEYCCNSTLKYVPETLRTNCSSHTVPVTCFKSPPSFSSVYSLFPGECREFTLK